MTEEKLKEVREYIVDLMRDPDIMFDCEIRGEGINSVDLMEVIASLYELLHQEVLHKSYNYMFHWANKTGAWVTDDLFTK